MDAYKGIIATIVGGITGVVMTMTLFGAHGTNGLALLGSLLGSVIGIGIVGRIDARAR